MENITRLKQQGNEAFKADDFKRAAHIYTNALNQLFLLDSPEKDSVGAVLLCNRSACCLYLGRYEECATDASTAMILDPTYAKADLRYAEANLQLKNIGKAVESFKMAIKKGLGTPIEQAARLGLLNAENQLRTKWKETEANIMHSTGTEVVFPPRDQHLPSKHTSANGRQEKQTKGVGFQKQNPSTTPELADVKKIASVSCVHSIAIERIRSRQSTAFGSRLSSDDCESQEGVHPSLECVEVPGKGLGLVATREIREGTLLIREHPRGLVLGENATNADLSAKLIGEIKSGESGPGFLLMDIINDMFPRTLEDRKCLHHPPADRSLTDLARDSHMKAEDVMTIQYAVMYNCHSTGYGDQDSRPHARCQEEAQGQGLYPCVSLLNHSCWPNVTHSSRNGIMSVYATRSISAGEEVCDSFINIYQNGVARRRQLKEAYAFDCRCDRCLHESNRSSVGAFGSHAIGKEAFAQLDLEIEHVVCPIDASHYMKSFDHGSDWKCSHVDCQGTISQEKIDGELSILTKLFGQGQLMLERVQSGSLGNDLKKVRKCLDVACNLWDQLLQRCTKAGSSTSGADNDTRGIIGAKNAFLTGVRVARAMVAGMLGDFATAVRLQVEAFDNSCKALTPNHPLLIPMCVQVALFKRKNEDGEWKKYLQEASAMHNICYGGGSKHFESRYAHEIASIRC